MANNYLQFSEQITHLNLKEKAFWNKVNETYFCEDCGTEILNEESESCPECRGPLQEGPPFSFALESDNSVWFYAEEYGDVKSLALVVQRFLKAFRPYESFSLSWSTTCSKLRIGQFSGGAVFVTIKEIEWFRPYTFLTNKELKFKINNGGSATQGE